MNDPLTTNTFEKKTFCFRSLASPTTYNLHQQLLNNGYTPITNPSTAQFSDDNLGADDEALQQLEYKHLLAELLTQHGLAFMPLTYPINNHTANRVIADIRAAHPTGNDPNNTIFWILKPSTLNNGEGILLFKTIDDIEAHYQRTDRLGGDFVIQQYIDNPHLLNGHKYTIRMFVILTNYNGHTLYPHGYYNIGRTKYPQGNDLSDLAAHLTNEHLTDPEPNVIQMPTTQVDAFHLIFPTIEQIVDKTITAFTQSRPDYLTHKTTKALDILGFDFLIDQDLNTWLLEINHGPCFPKDEPHPPQSPPL